MIVLDTNVLSALMLTHPDERVVRWLDQQPAESTWTTTITVFEIRFGLAILPKGKRRRGLEAAFDAMLEEDFAGRVLDFDNAAADAAASIAGAQRAAGKPSDIRDTMIAGIVAARKGILATRNTRHFVRTGVKLDDPWE